MVSVVWLHVNNCCKGARACLYQEGDITGIMFCHQNVGLISGRAYNWDFKVCANSG